MTGRGSGAAVSPRAFALFDDENDAQPELAWKAPGRLGLAAQDLWGPAMQQTQVAGVVGSSTISNPHLRGAP
jgi:hypothetical protein